MNKGKIYHINFDDYKGYKINSMVLVYIFDYFNVSIDYLIGKSEYKHLENEKIDIEKEILV